MMDRNEAVEALKAYAEFLKNTKHLFHDEKTMEAIGFAEESFKKHGMSLEEFEEDMYVEIIDGWQEKKDEGLKALWREFGDVSINPETERIEEDWRGWQAGTFREDIWRWFDERHSKGVAYLMYGESCRKKICKRCGNEVQEEKDAELAKEYPYYCPNCDENMYSFECREA